MTPKEFSERFSYNKSTDCLGKGGFGTVFKAWDNANDCYVALKMQAVDWDFPSARLKAEVERAETLNHRNVAKYKECYTLETFVCPVDVAVMSYYENGSLEDLIQGQQLNSEERASILRQILEGIAYLHNHDIIHRDLKPQNILILHHGGRYTPKITDFGISKQLRDGESGSVSNSLPILSRPYASPEQFLGGTIKKNTDLWSFGVVAYRMFTGSLPFNTSEFDFNSITGRESFFNLLKSGQLPDAVATIPEPWQRLIRACLTSNTELRPAHAEDCLAIISGGDATAVDPEPIAIPVEAVEVIPTPKPAPQPKPSPKVEPKSTPNPKPSAPATPAPKKRSKWWLWLLLLAIVGGGVFAYLNSQPKDNPEPIEEPAIIVADTIEAVDSTPVEEIVSAPNLRLTSDNTITLSHSGSNGTIRYSLDNPVSGVNLSVSDDASWLTTSRSGNTISYSASANESQSSRTATITVSYGGQGFEVAITQSGKPAPTYAVGDYYNVNGVKGVVFEISDGGRHGKIVSVDQAMLKWGPQGVDAPADSETNGKANTDAIMPLANRYSYRAFTWCSSKGSNWYLPAKSELQAIYRNRYAINATLRARGYTEVGHRYWSSTEYDEDSAWLVGVGIGSLSFDKYDRYSVRAVSAF